MAEIILGTRTTLYQLNAAKTAWEPFPIQPPGGRAVWGIWGGPNNTIWAHDGYFNGSGTNGKYLFFDGVSTWTEYAYPVTLGLHIPQTICGSEDGSRVYAGIGYLGATGHIHRWTGSAWVEVQSGYRAGSIWCDPTGQHVYATPGAGDGRAWVYYSDDYGLTWTNVYSTIIAQAGGSAWTMNVGSVHGTAADNVYVGIQWDGAGPPGAENGGQVYKWNGSVWSVYSQRPTDGPRGAGLHFGANALVYTGAGGSSTLRIFRDESGVGVEKKYTGHNTDTRGRSIAEMGDGTLLVACRSIFAQPADTFISTDDGDTWTAITHPWGTSGENVGSVTLANYVVGVPPELQNQNPSPSSSGNDSDTTVYLEVVDQNDNLDASTVDIYIDGTLVWTGDSIQQPGYSGFKVPVTNGYGYTISLWEHFDPGSHDIRVVAEDLLANSLDETYSFSTDAPAGICDHVQWGDFQWGAVEWNQCADFIVSAVAINEYTIRVYFGIAVQQQDPTGEDDALNPDNYTVSGGFRQLTVLNVSTVNSTTVDLTVLEMTDGASYSLDILFDPIAPELLSFAGLGVHPKVVSVTNETAGVLEVTFSEVMLNDTSFGRASSYIITPQGNAASIFVTGVVVNPDDTTGVTLSFVGGGSSYILSTPGLMDPAGNYCDPSDFLFQISNPTFDELEPTQKLYLDTDMGAMALGVSELSQRRVEDLAILRAKNEGHLRQFSLIADELERSGIDRDDRKLKLFKG